MTNGAILRPITVRSHQFDGGVDLEQHAWLFRGTNRVQGRKRIIDQTNSGLEFLRYGRVVLNGDELSVDTQGEEMAYICLNGKGQIQAGGQSYTLGQYDALYLPRDTRCSIESGETFDLAEIAAPVSRGYPVRFVSFQDEVLKSETLAKHAGFEPYSRRLHTVIGEENVQAGRLLAGVTMSKDGNWTSWPPHDHWEQKEEIYLYVDMPAPYFSLHLNYTDPKNMEMVVPVWEGDAVAIKRGYHYNVATPGTETRFVWMMAAVREEEDRVFTKVDIQPEFAGDRFKLF